MKSKGQIFSFWKKWSYAHGCVADSTSFPMTYSMSLYVILCFSYIGLKMRGAIFSGKKRSSPANYGTELYYAIFLKN